MGSNGFFSNCLFDAGDSHKLVMIDIVGTIVTVCPKQPRLTREIQKEKQHLSNLFARSILRINVIETGRSQATLNSNELFSLLLFLRSD